VPSSFEAFPERMVHRVDAGYADYRIRIQDDSGNISPWINYVADPDSQAVFAYADHFVIVHSRADEVIINDQQVWPLASIPFPNNYIKEIIPVTPSPDAIRLQPGGSYHPEQYAVFNSGGTVMSPDSAIAIELADSHLYGPTVLAITQPLPDNTGGYRFSILPENALFAATAAIKVSPARLGIDRSIYSVYYFLENKADWIYVGQASASDIGGETNGGGNFGILPDSRPPTITSIRPGNSSTTIESAPKLSCRIDDDLSGISKETQLEMTIDGLWVPAFYDIDNKTFTYQVRHGLSRGRHVLNIMAVDNQGNKAEATSRFTIGGSGR